VTGHLGGRPGYDPKSSPGEEILAALSLWISVDDR
jgi:hypothetical protein